MSEKWKLVPVEPTDEIAMAAFVYDTETPSKEDIENAKTDYRLMVDAAPERGTQAARVSRKAINKIAPDCVMDANQIEWLLNHLGVGVTK